MPKTKRNENDLSTNERKKSTENCQPRHLRSISREREERFMQAVHNMTKELCQLCTQSENHTKSPKNGYLVPSPRRQKCEKKIIRHRCPA